MKKIDWNKKIEILDFAFQPILDADTGIIYGVEALLRNYKEAGFESISSVFDIAYDANYLYTLDLKLREKAIRKYKKLKFHDDIKLFYNLDNRVLEMPNFSLGNTENILVEHKIKKSAMCFEISEKHRLNNVASINNMLSIYKNQGYHIAIDDFGSGFSNLQKLYHIEINLLKIDRFFISDVEKKSKKRLFVSNIVNLVHTLGGIVVAEGVETKEEYEVCRKIGCDLIQGYYVQKPTLDITEIKMEYPHVKENRKKEKVYVSEDRKVIEANLLDMRGNYIYESVDRLLEKLKEEDKVEIFPILDKQNRPLGIISEKEIKNYLLSPYGKELLKKKSIAELLSKALTADISISVERLIDIFSLDNEVEVILITEGGKYKGYLNKSAIIKVISEKKIVEARNQNPLTKMAGNISISDYIEKSLEDITNEYAYVYFDFNNFKVFNDRYGFKKGDEVIITFSEILKEISLKYNNFAGHIGGDDFFLGIKYMPREDYEDIFHRIGKIKKDFEERIIDYYEKEDLKKGYIKGYDRKGILREIPIMTIAAVILQAPKGRKKSTANYVSDIIFKLKKNAKSFEDSISTASLLN